MWSTVSGRLHCQRNNKGVYIADMSWSLSVDPFHKPMLYKSELKLVDNLLLDVHVNFFVGLLQMFVVQKAIN